VFGSQGEKAGFWSLERRRAVLSREDPARLSFTVHSEAVVRNRAILRVQSVSPSAASSVHGTTSTTSWLPSSLVP